MTNRISTALSLTKDFPRKFYKNNFNNILIPGQKKGTEKNLNLVKSDFRL